MNKLRKYELTLILTPQNAPEIQKAREDVESALEKRQAKIIRKEDWGERRLFHEKEHHSKGFFNFYQFEVDPANVVLINKDLNVNPGVLKTMIAKI